MPAVLRVWVAIIKAPIKTRCTYIASSFFPPPFSLSLSSGMRQPISNVIERVPSSLRYTQVTIIRTIHSDTFAVI